nr:MAG TPA: hypothetical protein [Bacteriophage sp.]
MRTNKQVKISLQDLQAGKYTSLRPVELLRTCSRCYIMQVQQAVVLLPINTSNKLLSVLLAAPAGGTH